MIGGMRGDARKRKPVAPTPDTAALSQARAIRAAAVPFEQAGRHKFTGTEVAMILRAAATAAAEVAR